jgi:hypothetical protein
VGVLEDLGVIGAVDGVGAEQPAEQQDLRRQKQPHAQHDRLELLRRRVEMVLEMRRVLVGRRCIAGGEGGHRVLAR